MKRFKCLVCGSVLKRVAYSYIVSDFDRENVLHYGCKRCGINWMITAFDPKKRDYVKLASGRPEP